MKTNGTSRRRSFRTGFIAGLLAGLVASGVMILISTLGSGLSLPEVVGSKLTALMPLAVFAYLQKLIGADAKYYLFYVIFAGQCVVFALSGGLFNVVLNVQGQRGRPQGSPPNATPPLPLRGEQGQGGQTYPPDRIPQGSPPHPRPYEYIMGYYWQGFCGCLRDWCCCRLRTRGSSVRS